MAQPVRSEKEKAHNCHVIFVIKAPDILNILHPHSHTQKHNNNNNNASCNGPFTSSKDLFQRSAQGQGPKIIYIFNICKQWFLIIRCLVMSSGIPQSLYIRTFGRKAPPPLFSIIVKHLSFIENKKKGAQT